jgi:hypothetical protein
MSEENRNKWAYLTAGLEPTAPGPVQLKESVRGRFLYVDKYEDQVTGQVVEIEWGWGRLRWSKRPADPKVPEGLSCGDWVPFPEPPEVGRYPWRADDSAS